MKYVCTNPECRRSEEISTTCAIVNDVICGACGNQMIKYVDVIGDRVVGQPAPVISYSYNNDAVVSYIDRDDRIIADTKYYKGHRVTIYEKE